MAKGSEQPSWAWSKSRECAGCGKTLKLVEVACWHRQAGFSVIFCISCYPDHGVNGCMKQMLRNPLRRRGKKTFWFLVDDHGTPLSKHKTHEEAERAYTELVAVDPAAADEVAVIRVDS